MMAPEQVLSYTPDDRTETYRSMYLWPNRATEIVSRWKHVGKSNSGTSWDEEMIPDEVVIDLDLKLSSQQELEEQAEQYYEAIAKFCPTDRFAIFSSGTGLHVHFCKSLFNIQPSKNVPYITKQVALAIERHISINKPCAIDTSIYHQVACYRMIGSINPKTNTRKRLLGGNYPFTPGHHVLSYMADYVVPEPVRHRPVETEYPAVTPCMTKLWQLGFEHAKNHHGRHNTVLALASWMVYNNMPKDIAELSIINWIEQTNIPYDRNDTIRSINEAYQRKVRFGCSSEILSTYCMSHCKLYDRKNNQSSKVY